MKELLKTKLENRISEFREALTAGIDGIVKAANIYVKAIDEDPTIADKFSDEFANVIPSNAWSYFEAVGRKWMHPRLLMGGMSDRKKHAVIKKLPYSVQEKVFNGDRFKLLTPSGDVLNVDLKEATISQMEQICNGDSIRTISAQKAWLVEKQSTKVQNTELQSIEENQPPYRINGGKVTFVKDVVLTRADIKKILIEM
jgi:hypothetical protein